MHKCNTTSTTEVSILGCYCKFSEKRPK